MSPLNVESLHKPFPNVTELSQETRRRLFVGLTKLEQLIPLLTKDDDDSQLADIALDYTMYYLLELRSEDVRFDGVAFYRYLLFLDVNSLQKSDYIQIVTYLFTILESFNKKLPTEVLTQILDGNSYSQNVSFTSQYLRKLTAGTFISTYNITAGQHNEKVETNIHGKSKSQDETTLLRTENAAITSSHNQVPSHPQPSDLQAESSALFLLPRNPEAQSELHNPEDTEHFIASISNGLKLCAIEIDNQAEFLETLAQSFETELSVLQNEIASEVDNRKESIKIFANFFDSKIERIFETMKKFDSFVDINNKLQMDVLHADTNLRSLFDIVNDHNNVQADLNFRLEELKQVVNSFSIRFAALDQSVSSTCARQDALASTVNESFKKLGLEMQKHSRALYDLRVYIEQFHSEYSLFKSSFNASKIQTNVDAFTERVLANEFDISLLKQENESLRIQLSKIRGITQTGDILNDEQLTLKALSRHISLLHKDRVESEKKAQQRYDALEKRASQTENDLRSILSFLKNNGTQTAASNPTPTLPPKTQIQTPSTNLLNIPLITAVSSHQTARLESKSQGASSQKPIIINDKDNNSESNKENRGTTVPFKKRKAINVLQNSPNVLKRIRLTKSISDEEESQSQDSNIGVPQESTNSIQAEIQSTEEHFDGHDSDSFRSTNEIESSPLSQGQSAPQPA